MKALGVAVGIVVGVVVGVEVDGGNVVTSPVTVSPI